MALPIPGLNSRPVIPVAPGNTRGKGAPGRPPGRPAGPRVRVGITQHQGAPAAAKQPGQRQQVRQAAAHRVAGTTSNPNPAAKAGLNPTREYATGHYASPAELAKFAAEQTKAADTSVAAPYRQAATEIGSAEQTALARNQAMGQTGQQTLAGLQAGEEASAKTGENNAAEAAIQAANTIRSAGAAGAMANGGYGGPEAAAALAQAGSQAGSLGAAASQYQSAMGLSGQSEMAQLRAAAAQRVTEGATRLGEGYQAAQQANTRAQETALSRVPTEAAAREAMGKSQVADRAALAAVGVKEGTLKVAEQKNRITAQGNREKNLTTRLDAREANRVKAQGNADKNQTQIAEKRDWTQIAIAEKNNRAKTEAAAIKAGGHSTAEETKLTNQLTAAYETVTQLAPGKWTKPQIAKALLEGKIGKTGIPRVTSPVLVQAAYELYMHHEINNATRAQLAALGFPSYIKPSEVVGLS